MSEKPSQEAFRFSNFGAVNDGQVEADGASKNPRSLWLDLLTVPGEIPLLSADEEEYQDRLRMEAASARHPD